MQERLAQFKADFFKALANPLRIRILDTLRGGAKGVNEISALIGVAPTSVSQQLAILRGRNLVVATKSGTTVYYEVRDRKIFKLLDAAREIFGSQLMDVRQTLRDLRNEAHT
ncbi:MAG: ArsR/SmtB family transcription factor [Terriglobia bacterium]